MTHLQTIADRQAPASSLTFAIEEACRRLPPLWPLKDFVAVNPFLGLADWHFLQAAALLRKTAHGEILMPPAYYLERLDSGDITEDDLHEALELARETLPPPWSTRLAPCRLADLRAELSDHVEAPKKGRVLTASDASDETLGTQWTPFLTDEISKWCSVYFDEGQSSWRMPWRDHSLFSAWREAIRYDANPRLTGLTCLNEVLADLPTEPLAAIASALGALKIPEGMHADFLHRQLLTVSGWSAYVQYRVRQEKMHQRTSNHLIELLAIRLTYDLAVWQQFFSSTNGAKLWADKLQEIQPFQPELDLLPPYLVLAAAEKSYQRRLLEKIRPGILARSLPQTRPSLQAVFCIDVRSEVFRRHLESQDRRIVTSGFAGFFGMPISYLPFGSRHGTAQCPVLFAPPYEIREGVSQGGTHARESRLRRLQLWQRLAHAWNAFKTSATSCFSFVETAGLWFGVRLGRDALAGRATPHWFNAHSAGASTSSCPPLELTGIALADQVNLAEGALRNMGLTRHFPRLILLCGHGSTSANNPYAAGLNCGACGGHAGVVNARVAVQILNQKTVRLELERRGISIPADTVFLAGLHDTTTDQITLADLAKVPESHRGDLSRCQDWLEKASQATRAERAPRLGHAADDPHLLAKLQARGRDWAQVRPEWGLANNAALIAAPRERTRGIPLDGRTFLHDYDPACDPEGKILELILTAPVIVAHWINLQYYASTVNNRLFGSGNKTLHNIVGLLGVWQGNGGDLQVGLPLQSLHDGQTWRHEPLRLSVVLESTRAAINRVLTAHPEVRELVQNGWLSLLALEPGSDEVWHYTCHYQWRRSPRLPFCG